MPAITKIYKNGYNGSTVQDTDLQLKPNTTKFGLILKLNMNCEMITYLHKTLNDLVTLHKVWNDFEYHK